MEAPYSRCARGIEQRLRPEHVRPEEPRRIDHRQRVVRLGSEVDHDLRAALAQRRLGELAIADVALDERDPILDHGQALPVTRIGEEVVDDELVSGVTREPVVDEVGADEAGSAGDEETHGAEG